LISGSPGRNTSTVPLLARKKLISQGPQSRRKIGIKDKKV